MKKITSGLNAHYLLIFLFMTSFGFSQSIATYNIVFTSNWNGTDHGTLPGNAHWSDMVGATHTSNVTFWEEGQLASAGIEDVAELGSNTAFNNEVDAAISNSDANQWLQKAFDAPNDANSGAILMNVEVSEDFPLLTLSSMIAPSPDWFIGINSFSLLDGNNNWKDNISIDLFPYDAGTEDGDDYDSVNPATNPQITISDRSNIVPFTGSKMGTLTITLESVLSVNTASFDNDIVLFPNPANGVLNISNIGPNKIRSVYIYNVLGKLVKTIYPSNNSPVETITISELKSGLFLVKLKSDSGQSIVKKLVVNN